MNLLARIFDIDKRSSLTPFRRVSGKLCIKAALYFMIRFRMISESYHMPVSGFPPLAVWCSFQRISVGLSFINIFPHLKEGDFPGSRDPFELTLQSGATARNVHVQQRCVPPPFKTKGEAAWLSPFHSSEDLTHIAAYRNASLPALKDRVSSEARDE